MKKRDRFWEWLKAPHGVWLAVIYVATAATSVGAIVVAVLDTPPLPYCIVGYAVYGAAAVLLGYSVYTIVRVIPAAKHRIIGWLKKRRFTRMLLDEFDFQTLVFSISSFVVDVGYALYNGVIGIVAASLWYLAFSGYYLMLGMMRGSILLYHYYKKK